jgi:hypothetical protein
MQSTGKEKFTVYVYYKTRAYKPEDHDLFWRDDIIEASPRFEIQKHSLYVEESSSGENESEEGKLSGKNRKLMQNGGGPYKQYRR